jgi:SAM-dependent methyltransferase
MTMRRRTKLALVAGGATAAVASGALARRRLGGRGPEAMPPDDDAMFTVYAPGGRFGFLANGPVGRVISKLIPIFEAGVYDFAAEMLDLQPEDELLDIGCGPGAFLAAKAQHVRRVVGLDLSRVMLREAERRLADRIAAGTARLVTGSAATLPFDEGEFSAASAIFAPVNHAEAYRVLRPGGRLVFADNDPRRSPSEPASAWGRRRYDEADHRRMFEDAGFTDVTLRYRGAPPVAGELFVSGRKPGGS